MRAENISVVIPTRNRKKVLLDTLRSIINQDTIPTEVIIVDQSDDPIDYNNDLSLFPFDLIRIIYQEQPSLTKARNRGLAEAKTDIVVFCDDDVVFLNDFIKYVNERMIEKTVMVACYDQLTIKDVKKADRGLNFIRPIFLRGKRNMDRGYVCSRACVGGYPYTEGIVTTEWAMGYFFAVRKDLVSLWAMYFDEALISYGYGEDYDFTYRYSKRAKESGLETLLVSDILLEHRAVLEGRISSEKSAYMYVIHRYYLSQKLFGRISVFGLLWSDVHEFIRRLVIKDHPITILKAHIVSIKNLRELKAGNINNELYKYLS